MSSCQNCGEPDQAGRFCGRCGLPVGGVGANPTEPEPGSGTSGSSTLPAGPYSPAPPTAGQPAQPPSGAPGSSSVGRRVTIAAVSAGIVGLLVVVAIAAGQRGSPTPEAAAGPPTATSSDPRDQVAPDPSDTITGMEPTATTATRPPSTAPSTPFAPQVSAATASCVAPDSVDAAGQPQSYQPAKAVDGRLDTAWRCAGDGVGASITVQFGGPVSLTSVGLVGGFDKVDPSDGADRFTQSPRVLRVRWTFDGAGAVEATPGGQRSMYVTPVSVRASSVTLTILQTEPGIDVTNKDGVVLPPLNTMAVSELAFTGLR